MKLLSSIILAFVAFTIGFLAQRSRMCFIAGLRDFILVRDGELLKGLFAFLATVWLLSSIFYGAGLISDGIPAPLFDESKAAAAEAEAEAAEDTGSKTEADAPVIETSVADAAAYELQLKLLGTGIIASPFLWASILGGFLLGLITTAAGGCVMRQHVLAAQGNGDAIFFIIGFFSMIAAYDLFLRRIVNEWF